MGKYGARGYRFALLEAGHQAENICLMAVQLGLDSLCIGGFHDMSLNTILGIDGNVMLLFTVLLSGLVRVEIALQCRKTPRNNQ